MHLQLLLFIIPFSLAYYEDEKNLIQSIDQKKWKEIASGRSPFIWMINFYCKTNKTNDGRCDKSYKLRNEYTDAASILQGVVKCAAYQVTPDFPAFVRIPSVMLYLPKSKEPYVYEMENFPEQIKRPSFRLVHYVQDVILNHMNSFQIRNIRGSWTFSEIKSSLVNAIVSNEVQHQCYFILLYESIKQSNHWVQLLSLVATAIQNVYNIPTYKLDFGAVKIRDVKAAIKDWSGPYVAPKFWFFGPRNSPQNKQISFTYDGRMDVVDITRWVIARYADIRLIPANAVQINIKREAGFVGQMIKTEKTEFILATM